MAASSKPRRGDGEACGLREADACLIRSADLAHHPDSRSMATSGQGSGIVGYNVQVLNHVQRELVALRATCHVH